MPAGISHRTLRRRACRYFLVKREEGRGKIESAAGVRRFAYYSPWATSHAGRYPQPLKGLQLSAYGLQRINSSAASRLRRSHRCTNGPGAKNPQPGWRAKRCQPATISPIHGIGVYLYIKSGALNIDAPHNHSSLLIPNS